MSPRRCLLWTALILAQPGFAQLPQNKFRISDQNRDSATPPIEIPFKLYRDYLIVVQGSLGPLQRVNFLLDTGVNPTAVDRRVAKKLRLAGPDGELALFGQDAAVREVLLPSLQLGPIRAESLPAVALDLSSFERILGVPIDAMVGFGVLNRSFRVDYKSKKIVFGPFEPSASAVPFDTGPPVLTVQLLVQDEPVRFLVDTGAAELVLFECRLHGRLHELPAGYTRRFFNGTGKELELKKLRLPRIRLGTTDLGIQEVLSTSDNANCGQPFDGVVGISHLGLKWVGFDFEHQRFSWRR